MWSWRIAVALVLTLALLPGCAKAPAPEATETAATTTTIKMLSMGEDDALTAVINAYQEKHPNDRIQLVPFDSAPGANVFDELRRQVKVQEMDVVTAFDMSIFVPDGLVQPLDPYIQKAAFDLQPFGPALESRRIEGKLYELPYSLMVSIIAYNTEMFREAGVSPPTDGWTWDDLRAAAQRLTTEKNGTKVWGFAPQFPEMMVSTYLQQWRGEVEPLTANEKRVRDALQLFGSMVQIDKSMPPVAKREAGGPATFYAREELRERKAAISLMDLFEFRIVQTDKEAKLPVDMLPLPVAPGATATSRAQAQSLGISARSQQPEAAWRFIQFVTGPEGAAILARAGSLPLYNSADVKKAWFEQEPPPPPGTEALFNTTWSLPPHTNPKPSGADMSGLAQAWSQAVNDLLSGSRSWEEAFANYQQALKEYQAANQGG